MDGDSSGSADAEASASSGSAVAPSAGPAPSSVTVPDDAGFYRPYHGGAKFRPEAAFVEAVVEFTWLDAVSGQTIPTLYGGRYPLAGRDGPRLRVVVYRITRDWVPARAD